MMSNFIFSLSSAIATHSKITFHSTIKYSSHFAFFLPHISFYLSHQYINFIDNHSHLSYMKDRILHFYISFSLSNEMLYFYWPQIVLNLSIFLNTLHFELTILYKISLSRFVKTQISILYYLLIANFKWNIIPCLLN